jgi:dTDP-4-amino-4,6-dideoxygalactose transaminase
VSEPLPLAAPLFGEEEALAVEEVVRSAWLTMGPRTAEFEERFAAMVGTAHAVMTSSCTAALHLAYASLGLGPGDEVIVPSLTFVATANAAAYTGADVVFADITALDRPVIDPDAVAALIGPRTAAICAVHYAGYMADMPALRTLAGRHGLALIEDAAHAPGASGPGGPAGAAADLGCFSFFSNKNLVTGEGGMVTTDDADLAARLRLLRAHGMTATSWDRARGHASGYDVVARGFNYRPSELEAALGLVQLGRLDGMNARRRELVARYRDAIAARGAGTVPFSKDEDADSACHILPLVARDRAARDDIRMRAKDDGIQTSVHYSPVHLFEVFSPRESLPLTEAFSEQEVTLPLFPAMTDADVDRVAASLPSAVAS